MKRVTEKGKACVHFFADGKDGLTLCGKPTTAKYLLGEDAGDQMKETHDVVTCPECARIYCLVKNAPCNEVDGNVLDVATYAAVGVEVEPEGVPHDETDYTGTPWEAKNAEDAK